MRLRFTMFGLMALIAVVLSLSAAPALAQPPTVSIEAPSCVPPGGSFVAKVTIGAVTDLSLATYRITYDPSVLAVTDVTDGDIGGSTADISNVDDWLHPESEWYGWHVATGELRIVQGAYLAGEHGLTGSGYLVELHFDVIGSAGDTSAIVFANEFCEAFDYNEQPIALDWIGTSVCVSICGDVNCDELANMADVQTLWYDLANYPAPDVWQICSEWAADVNCDGLVNMADVQTLWYDLANYPAPDVWLINCCD